MQSRDTAWSSLVDRLLAGERRALARLITRVEDADPRTLELMDRLWERRPHARVLGVTGPPGAGKSTLVDRFIAHHRAAGREVAVLAVDPSSPFSGGAILGDRIRMQRHAADPGVFIRSLGTRGHHGGLTRATLEAAVLCAAAGFEQVLIETVGVGQTELEVVGLADQVAVVLVPEAGDVVQTMKAGLLEGADLFIVNKADRPGADRMVGNLRAMVQERPAAPGEELPDVPVRAVSALDGSGLDALLAELDERLAGATSQRRLVGVELVARLVGEEAARRASQRARRQLGAGGEHAALAESLRAGTVNPYAALRRLLAGAP